VEDKFRDFWKKLGKRDRLVLSAGGALVITILVIQFALVPFIAARQKLTKSIRTNEKILKEMIALESDYRVFRKDMETVQGGLARRAPTFTLFSFLEKKAGDTGIRSNIKNMQASRALISGPYVESDVEVTLEKITLKQLVNFLQAIESSEDLVRVKRLAIKKSTDNVQYLTVVLQVATYELSKTEAG